MEVDRWDTKVDQWDMEVDRWDTEVDRWGTVLELAEVALTARELFANGVVTESDREACTAP